MSVTVLSPNATQHTWLIAKALAESGHLDSFVTHGMVSDTSFARVQGLLPASARERISEHHVAGRALSQRLVRPRPFLGSIPGLLGRVGGLSRHPRYQRFEAQYFSFCVRHSTSMNCPRQHTVWQAGSADLLLERPYRETSANNVLYVPHPLKEMEAEIRALAISQYPAWSETYKLVVDNESRKRVATELSCADKVLVASRTTLESLPQAQRHKARVVPYPVQALVDPGAQAQPEGALKVLYLGAVCLRKGAPVLLAAIGQVRRRDIEVHLVGNVVMPDLNVCDDRVIVHGRVSEAKKQHLIRTADVLVLPSYLEGFGYSLLEGYGAGKTSISTNRTVARDLLDDDAHYIVPVGDPMALAAQIECLDRSRLRDQGRHAYETIRRTASYETYSERLFQAIAG